MKRKKKKFDDISVIRAWKIKQSSLIFSFHHRSRSMLSALMEYILTGSLWTMSNFYVRLWKNTCEKAHSYVSSQYRILTSGYVTSLVKYDTTRIKAYSLYRLSFLDLTYAYYLKYVSKNMAAFEAFMDVDVVDKIKNSVFDRDAPDSIYKVTYGDGSSMVLPQLSLKSILSNTLASETAVDPSMGFRTYVKSMIMTNTKTKKDKPSLVNHSSMHFGNISIDRYVSHLVENIVGDGYLTAKDIIAIYYLDQKSKWFNSTRIKQIFEILLCHGPCLKYFDEDFNELEYKGSDIVL